MMQVNYFDITTLPDNPDSLLPVHDLLQIQSPLSLEDDVFCPQSVADETSASYFLYTQVPQLFRRDSTPSIINCQNINGGFGLSLAEAGSPLPDLIPSPEPPRLLSDFEDDFGQRPVSDSPSRLI